MTDTAQDIATKRGMALIDRLLGEPGSRGKAVREAAKEMFPDVVLGDPDASTEAALAPLKAELEAMKAERAAEKEAAEAAAAKALEDRAGTEFETKLTATKKAFHLTDDGVQAVLERMKATGNYASPDDAAAFVLKDHKPVETRSAALGPQAADFLGKASAEDADRMKLLWNDPDGAFLDYEISKMESDPDRYARTYAPEFFVVAA